MHERDHMVPDPEQMPAYSVLAAGYDVVMEHVDYALWAQYVHQLLQKYHPKPECVLELGCGTGSLALELQPMGDYLYAATDGSEAMLEVARRKAELENAAIQFEQADFTNFRVDRAVDAVILLYDGLNYLLDLDSIRDLLSCTYEALRPGGLFIFDQSTPANSVNNELQFEDEGQVDVFSYVRKSRYDRRTRLHTTTLDISVEDRTFRERHVERAYRLDEIRPLIVDAGLEVEAVYEDFTSHPASEESERAHWVLRRPEDRSRV